MARDLIPSDAPARPYTDRETRALLKKRQWMAGRIEKAMQKRRYAGLKWSFWRDDIPRVVQLVVGTFVAGAIAIGVRYLFG